MCHRTLLGHHHLPLGGIDTKSTAHSQDVFGGNAREGEGLLEDGIPRHARPRLCFGLLPLEGQQDEPHADRRRAATIFRRHVRGADHGDLQLLGGRVVGVRDLECAHFNLDGLGEGRVCASLRADCRLAGNGPGRAAWVSTRRARHHSRGRRVFAVLAALKARILVRGLFE